MAAGFSSFLTRSLDSTKADTLRQAASEFRQQNNQTVNFDQTQTTGSLGDVIQIGDIHLDGNLGRISVFEGPNEVVRIGELDG